MLIAGDLLEDDREAGLVARRLRRALGDLPALYVTGNHEVMGEGWISGPQRNDRLRVARSMAEHGIHRIDERAVDLDGIAVVGIGWHRGIGPGILVERLLASTGRAVVLTHSPDHVVDLPPDLVIVALCGHTHGGQVRLPLIGAPWLPVRSPLPRLAGAMSLGGVRTFVSRGIGATIPVRLGAVPEATLIEIVPLQQ